MIRVTLVHALPHRVRVRAKALLGRRDVAERLAMRLVEDSPYERVIVRERTGSILIEAPGATLDASRILSRVTELLSEERDERGLPLDAPRTEPAGPTRLAHAVVQAAAGINADIRRSLEHEADLGTLLPLAFAGLGLAEVTSTGKLPSPSWFSLLWWSLRSFMTFNVAAVEEAETAPGAAEREHRNGQGRSPEEPT